MGIQWSGFRLMDIKASAEMADPRVPIDAVE
jgi:hypothetical protein